MRLTFGLDLDHGVWPHPLLERDALAGEAAVGPERLLETLETHLGLARRPVHECLRTAGYLRILRQADSPGMFFHRSFQVDPWSVARELLRWYDALVDGGWQGEPLSISPRLDTLSRLPAPPVDGTPSRVRYVSEALPEVVSFVDTLTLVDPMDHLSASWRRLLARLPVVEGCQAPRVPPEPVSDLARLQIGTGRAQGDGSVLHMRGDSPDETAELLTAWLASRWDDLGTTVVVCEAGLDFLDAALTRQGLPTCGSSRGSSWRPACQVLPLMLSLAWSPLDPGRLMEYLTLPQSPLPMGRLRLAQALRQEPGWGGPEWDKGWEEAIRQTLQYSGSESEAAVRERFHRWLGGTVPLCAFGRNDGIPVEAAIAGASAVTQWASSLLSLDTWRNDHDLQAARLQATAFRQILAQWSRPTIPALHLDQIFSELTSVATQVEVSPAQAGRLYRVRSPGAVIGPADTVIWWGFVTPEGGPHRLPFVMDELAGLAERGIRVDTQADSLRRVAYASRRPLLWAQRQLVLASWSARGQTAMALHPLYDEFRVRFTPDSPAESAVTLTRPQAIQQHMLHLTTVEPRRSPGQHPLWRLPENVVQGRTADSASSLETLLRCTLKWTLEYGALIRSRAVGGVPEGRQLYGILAHQVLQSVITSDPREDPELLAARHFDRLVPWVAAALLLPARTVELSSLRRTVVHASRDLARHLDRSRYEVVGVEVELPSRDNLEGRADVVLRHVPTGRAAVLDIKWTSRKYREKLMSGTAIQLAVYTHLVDSGLASGAYFSVSDGALLCLEGSDFPSALAARGPALAQTLEYARRTQEGLLAAVRQGHVRATGFDGIDHDRIEDGRIVLGPPCKYCDHRRFCGWTDS